MLRIIIINLSKKQKQEVVIELHAGLRKPERSGSWKASPWTRTKTHYTVSQLSFNDRETTGQWRVCPAWRIVADLSGWPIKLHIMARKMTWGRLHEQLKRIWNQPSSLVDSPFIKHIVFLSCFIGFLHYYVTKQDVAARYVGQMCDRCYRKPWSRRSTPKLIGFARVRQLKSH